MDHQDNTQPTAPQTAKLFRARKEYRETVPSTSDVTGSEIHTLWLVRFQFVENRQIIDVEVSSKFKLTLGRTTSNIYKQPFYVNLHLESKSPDSISRLHAGLHVRNGSVAIQDLGSTNGTFINGNRLKPYVDYKLRVKDTIWLGLLGLAIEEMTPL